ncbi:hypothetical protein [Thalassotalea aquiviva]|uniref:hypothetical protein n=1 Tax=Thalassotalea aquiviva TaxID=3242415 RepID=UPI00352B252A
MLTNRFLQIDEFCQHLVNMATKRVPFSFIRLGDGEGAMLDFSEKSTMADVDYLREHFGPDCTIEQTYSIQKILKQTINNADLIGVRDDILGVTFNPDAYHSTERFMQAFKQAFNLRQVEKSLPYKDAKRISMLHKQLTIWPSNKLQNICSQFIGWDFFSSGALPYILQNQQSVGIISSRKEIGHVMQEALSADIVHYQIPDKFERQSQNAKRHYPTAYYELSTKIDVKYPGMVFIVGAGIVGKGYCQTIKERGGIALDLGGVVDAWVGKLTRPKPLMEKYDLKKQYRLKFKKKFIPIIENNIAIPEQFIMSKENIEKLSQKWQQRQCNPKGIHAISN